MIAPLSVAAGMMCVGLIACAPALVLEGVPSGLGPRPWLWLGVAGVGNVSGLVICFAAYRRGQVAMIVPLISSDGAIAAVIAITSGESLGAVPAGALALVAVGVGLTSTSNAAAGGRRPGSHRLTVGLAAVAAVLFGVSLYATGRAATLLPTVWVVVSARVVGTLTLGVPLALRGRLRLPKAVLPLVAGAGVAEVVGFLSYTLATRHSIAVAAVLSSQSAPMVVAAAYVLFGERLSRLQLLGICVIAVGVSVLAGAHA